MAFADHKQQLSQDGFAIVPDVIDMTMVKRMREALEGLDNNDAVRRRRGSMFAIRNLFEIAPELRKLAESNSIRLLIEPLLSPDTFVVRAIFFDKTPEANWTVSWHQDVTIAVEQRIDTPGFGPWSVKAGVPHVRPPAELLAGMLTIRIHLDDCDASNGALQVLGGTHRRGFLDGEALSGCREHPDLTLCEVPTGGVVLMRPLLAHASSSGTRPGRRRVIHLEFAAVPLPGNLAWHRA